jgi:hypothetical protein
LSETLYLVLLYLAGLLTSTRLKAMSAATTFFDKVSFAQDPITKRVYVCFSNPTISIDHCAFNTQETYTRTKTNFGPFHDLASYVSKTEHSAYANFKDPNRGATYNMEVESTVFQNTIDNVYVYASDGSHLLIKKYTDIHGRLKSCVKRIHLLHDLAVCAFEAKETSHVVTLSCEDGSTVYIGRKDNGPMLNISLSSGLTYSFLSDGRILVKTFSSEENRILMIMPSVSYFH